MCLHDTVLNLNYSFTIPLSHFLLFVNLIYFVMSVRNLFFLHLEHLVWPWENGVFSSCIQILNSQLFVTSCTSANWTSSRVSFTSCYTTALEIKASRYDRIDLLLSYMHSSDENLLLSFTQETGVSCEIMASLNWSNSKMSYLFGISRIKQRIKHGSNTHSAFRSTIRPDNWNYLSWHESNINTNAFFATLSERSLANRKRTSFWQTEWKIIELECNEIWKEME